MTNKQRGLVEIIVAVLMMLVLVKMLFTTKANPKSYVCQPRRSDGYLICDYQY